MKKKQNLFTGLVAALLLSSCSQEELGEQGTALPEGEYPLQIGSVTFDVESSAEPWNAEGPQTRVAENDNGTGSVWEGNEQIGVQIGRGQPGIYTVQADGSVVAENPVYWTSTAITYVNAWYPMEETVNLRDQSDRLAYVLNATQDYVTYDQPVTLSFTHQLAKVRVVLGGTQAGQVESVKIYGITACNHLRGMTVNYDASNTGWIKMKKQTFADDTECWEANVVPGEVISQIKVNNTEATLTKPLTPKVAALNTITINVEQAPTEIDLDTYEGPTLTVSGEAVITGKNDNLQIILQADADVTLQDAELSYTGLSPILCQGDASLTLAGSNTLTATSVAYNFETGTGIYVENGTLTIDAESGASLAINRTGGGANQQYGAGIGVTENANLIINGGTIIVNDIESSGYDSGAGIGGLYNETSGNITIAGGTITIGQPSWWSAGIGGGCYGNCKNITITGSSTVITVEKGSLNDHYIGCSQSDGNVEGTITIGGGATVNGTRYDNTHTGPL